MKHAMEIIFDHIRFFHNVINNFELNKILSNHPQCGSHTSITVILEKSDENKLSK